MSTFFRYLFYRIYTWNLKKWGERDFPQLNALFGVSFLMFSNLLAIYQLILLMFAKTIPIINDSIKIVVAFCGVVILLLNYFTIVRNSKYHDVIEQFQDENLNARKAGTIKIAIYLIITLSLPFSLAILTYKLDLRHSY